MTDQSQGYHLSPQQRRLFLLHGNDPAYRAQCVILIEGDLNPSILMDAVRQIIERHEILRTTFRQPPGLKEPIQIVSEAGHQYWRVFDLKGLNHLRHKAEIDGVLQSDGALPFDLTNPPLLRLFFLSAGPKRSFLIVTLPALCADSRTLNNLVDEIHVRYNLLSSADRPPGEVIQYAEFAAWQNELSGDEYACEGREYWRGQLTGAINVTLPFERRAMGECEFAPAASTITLDRDEMGKIQAFVSARHVSMPVLLLSCWLTSLWKITGQNDLVVGVISEGRKYEGMQEAMGLYAGSLPLRSQLRAELSFDDVMKQVNESLVNIRAWEEYFPGGQRGQTGQAEGVDFDGPDAGNFPIAFEFEDAPQERNSGGVSFSVYERYVCIDLYKIKLSCLRGKDSLVFELRYDRNCFEPSWATLIAQYFKTLLFDAIANADSSIGRLKLSNDADSLRLTGRPRDVSNGDLSDLCLHQLFEKQVARSPDRIAAVFEDHQITYAELNTRANRLAHYLSSRAVGADTPVGLCVRRSLEMIVGLLGALKAGGAYLPLDPSHPRERLVHLLAETKAPVLLTEAALLDQVAGYRGQIVCLDRDGASLEKEPCGNPSSSVTPQNLCYIIFTSGSTGGPKGVAVTHQNLVSYTNSIHRKLRLSANPSLRFATVSTLSADLGNTAIYPSLVSGGCLHIIGYEMSVDPDSYAEYSSSRLIDVLKIVPSHFNALIEARRPQQVVPSKYLIFGGESLSYELLDRVSNLSAACKVINHYGPTETTIGALAFEHSRDFEEARVSSTVPIGRPLGNSEVYLLDQELGLAPIGVLGEAHIGGLGVARGYLEKPDQSGTSFIPHSFTDDHRGKVLYKTGDLARYLPDGNIEFVGRIDDQVKIHGHRIELREIESALKRHPGVRECVVSAEGDKIDRKRLIAYFAPERNRKLSADELRAFLRRILPEPMIPSMFVSLTALPLTPNGKVDRSALSKVKGPRVEREGCNAAPRTPTEEKLMRIWSDTLRVDRIGVYDNFFELGGDSILSIRVVAGANQNGLRLTPKQIFDNPTIAQLALVAERCEAAEFHTGPVDGDVLLTPIQLRFFEGNPVNPDYFNQSVLLELSQPLSRADLEEAVGRLLSHHDALRMRFENHCGGWRQFYSEPGNEVPLVEVDMSELGEAERQVEVETVAGQLQRSLSLSEGPMLRVGLFNFGKNASGRILLVIHHLVVDGVSWRILLEDLEGVYVQISRRERAALPPKTSSYKQWGERLNSHAQSDEALAVVENYWRGVCEQETRELPTDRAGGVNSVGSVKQVRVRLESELTDALLREAPKAYGTQINDVLLTALAQTLCEWAGGQVVSVDLEGHGREDLFADLDLTRTIGWFTTHMPIRLELGARNEWPGAALKSIKEQLRRPPMGGLGFSLLRRLRVGTEMGEKLKSMAEPAVSFNYLGQLDQALAGSRLFRPARESAGANCGAYERRKSILEVVGWVADGALNFNWNYSENFHDRATIEKVALGHLNALREIIEHCRAPEAGGWTPSDFPYAELSQTALDKVIAAVAAAAELGQ
jgi:amino acid adenylation domain-containing protein/non-ribosomal peptide synthase protein (TIGR01720 family)